MRSVAVQALRSAARRREERAAPGGREPTVRHRDRYPLSRAIPVDASIHVAGAVKADSIKRHVRQLFADTPRGPAITRQTPPTFAVKDTFIVAEDRVLITVVGDLAKVRAGIEALKLGDVSVIEVGEVVR